MEKTTALNQALAAMQAIVAEQDTDVHHPTKDTEDWHAEADMVLRELVLNLGGSDVIAAYDGIAKWYA